MKYLNKSFMVSGNDSQKYLDNHDYIFKYKCKICYDQGGLDCNLPEPSANKIVFLIKMLRSKGFVIKKKFNLERLIGRGGDR